jgi:hypothetical protein
MRLFPPSFALNMVLQLALRPFLHGVNPVGGLRGNHLPGNPQIKRYLLLNLLLMNFLWILSCVQESVPQNNLR